MLARTSFIRASPRPNSGSSVRHVKAHVVAPRRLSTSMKKCFPALSTGLIEPGSLYRTFLRPRLRPMPRKYVGTQTCSALCRRRAERIGLRASGSRCDGADRPDTGWSGGHRSGGRARRLRLYRACGHWPAGAAASAAAPGLSRRAPSGAATNTMPLSSTKPWGSGRFAPAVLIVPPYPATPDDAGYTVAPDARRRLVGVRRFPPGTLVANLARRVSMFCEFFGVGGPRRLRADVSAMLRLTVPKCHCGLFAPARALIRRPENRL
jgi:hypothetical protein